MRGVLGGKISFLLSLILASTILVLASGCDREGIEKAKQQAEADQAAAAAAATATPTPSGVPNSPGTTNNAGTTNSADSVAPEGNTAGAGKSLNTAGCVKAVAPDTGTVSKLPTNAPSSAQKAAQYACSKLGSLYVWGATGPSTFDCSGLVMWAYKQAGVNLPRVAADQARVGSRVTGPPEDGDLVPVEPNSSGQAQHIGMVVSGGTQVINAPSSDPKDNKVKLTPLAKFREEGLTPNGIRRVV